jgi:hypothetical protein
MVNAAVVAVDRMLQAEDRALAMSEMAMGAPLASRDLDCGFGANVVEPSDVANAFSPVVLGTGVFRRYGESAPAVVHSDSPYEVGFDLVDLLGGFSLSDVYGFGATYALLYRSTGTPVFSYACLPFRGGSTNMGVPLQMARTISPAEALELLQSQYMPEFAIDVDGGWTDVTYLELQRFVLDVETYDPGSPTTAEVKVYFADVRAPRGWGGLADEVAGPLLTPPAVSAHRTQVAVAAQASQSLYNFVSEWVNLSAWEPDFVTYWTTYGSDMPARLKQYLLDELSIILP